jgi:hypothetical protein
MNRLRVTSLVLACALLAPALASATPKPLDPATVHDRIAKRGVGSWVCVQEANGVALVGRVVNIGDDHVGLQLANYPEITPVLYTDIVGLRFGISRKTLWTITAIGFGAVATMAAVGIHEVNSMKTSLPTQPTQPTYPYAFGFAPR